MDADNGHVEPPSAVPPVGVVPEVEAYAYLLVTMYLIDHKLNVEVRGCPRPRPSAAVAGTIGPATTKSGSATVPGLGSGRDRSTHPSREVRWPASAARCVPAGGSATRRRPQSVCMKPSV
jgi:hypothetical protein